MIYYPSARLFRPVRPVGLVRLVRLSPHSFPDLPQKSTLYSPTTPFPPYFNRLSVVRSSYSFLRSYEKTARYLPDACHRSSVFLPFVFESSAKIYGLFTNCSLRSALQAVIRRPLQLFVPPLLRKKRALSNGLPRSPYYPLPTSGYPLSWGGFEAELNLTRVPFLPLRPVSAMIYYPSARLFRPVSPVGLVRPVRPFFGLKWTTC
jgi:hypothetical protein